MIVLILLAIVFIVGLIISRGHGCSNIDFLGITMIIYSGIAIITCILMILGVHISVDYKINEDHIQYEGLCRRLETINSDYEDVSKSEVIKDITEWNTQVYHDQYWANNPWTNWFYSKERVEAKQYIPLDIKEDN